MCFVHAMIKQEERNIKNNGWQFSLNSSIISQSAQLIQLISPVGEDGQESSMSEVPYDHEAFLLGSAESQQSPHINCTNRTHSHVTHHLHGV